MGNLVDLTKKAGVVLEKKQLTNVKANIAVAVDISGSMYYEFQNGVVQEVIDRLLGIGMNMDIDKSIDVFAFNHRAEEVGKASEENHKSFVKNVFLRKVEVTGGTAYAPVMEQIVNKYTEPEQKGGFLAKLFGKGRKEPDLTIPTFVFFITDGENSDRVRAEKLIRDAANKPVFWQFVGIGNENFYFLDNLDNMNGRFIDNCNFFQVNDISRISDEELYDRLLNEFPSWLNEAKAKGVVK